MHRGLYARAFRGTAIEVADGEPVTLVNRVQSPSTLGNRIAGPYLVLVVVGEYPDGPGHMPLRGYAQPVLNGRLPVPVESEFERRTLQAILAAQVRLHHQGIDMAIDKPMFDTLTRDGPCRPDFRIEARSRVTGEIRVQTLVTGCVGDARPDCPIIADLEEPAEDRGSVYKPDGVARLRHQSITKRRVT